MRIHIGRQLGGVSVPPLDAGDHHLAPFRIRNADNANLADRVMFLQNGFYFLGMDALAAGPDHVVYAPNKCYISVPFLQKHIAGIVPPVLLFRSGGVRAAKIFREYRIDRSIDNQFALLARGDNIFDTVAIDPYQPDTGVIGCPGVACCPTGSGLDSAHIVSVVP